MGICIIERTVSVNGRSARCTHPLRATLDGMAPWWQTNKQLRYRNEKGARARSQRTYVLDGPIALSGTLKARESYDHTMACYRTAPSGRSGDSATVRHAIAARIAPARKVVERACR
jgi:hypothetical protein